jgi:hypothetical protein
MILIDPIGAVFDVDEIFGASSSGSPDTSF